MTTVDADVALNWLQAIRDLTDRLEAEFGQDAVAQLAEMLAADPDRPVSDVARRLIEECGDARGRHLVGMLLDTVYGLQHRVAELELRVEELE